MILQISSYSVCSVFLLSPEKLVKLVGCVILKKITQDLSASEKMDHTEVGENDKFRQTLVRSLFKDCIALSLVILLGKGGGNG